MIKPQYLWRRPGRWLRRTGWLLKQMRADFGVGAAGGPIWLRDNPFLVKTGRAEVRRLGLSLRLAMAVVLLGGLLAGGLSQQNRLGGGAALVLNFLFRASFPAVLFVALSFVHVLLIANARTALAVSLAEEARRATLPELLMTPLRRAEMVLAMGVGPARSAFLIALAGLPVYVLLGQFGGLTGGEIACLYVLFALLCFQPPAYAVPALSGLAATPESPPGQFAAAGNRRLTRRVGAFGIGFPLLLGFSFFGQALGVVRGGWLTHLSSALHLSLFSGFSFLLFLSWPYYAAQLLSERLPFFHTVLSPLFYVLPLTALFWASSALGTASALSAGSLPEMRRLPLWTRAQTLGRWTARLAAVCGLAVVWRAWVESGDTAGLAREFGSGPGWDAAGLLLLLGGFSLPNVCARAQAVDPRLASLGFRAPALVLRCALKRSLRPLGVAGGMFLTVCAFGGLSPFAAPVYQIAGKLLLIGVGTVVWAVGVRRAAPQIGKWAWSGLLYGVPFFALSLPGFSVLAALSPAAAWVSLFAPGPALVSQFPVWSLGMLPPFQVCAAGPFVVGLVLMTAAHQQKRKPAKIVSVKRVATRNEARTAALMRWIMARTDNPLFIYEMRVRTRSGRWFDWLSQGSPAFAAVLLVALAFPAFIDRVSFVSPFHFFSTSAFSIPASPALGLASLLLLLQCYLLGIRGPLMGEALIAKDRQQGTWGFLLISPLTIGQIFWGKMLGQTMGIGVIWTATGLACLLLYLVSVPQVGLGPAVGAWGSGQLLVAALLTLGVSLSAALMTFSFVQRSFKGLGMLLFLLAVGGIIYLQYQLVPLDASGDWSLLAFRLLLGSVFALVLSALLFWFALWRLARLRQGDIAAGDSLMT